MLVPASRGRLGKGGGSQVGCGPAASAGHRAEGGSTVTAQTQRGTLCQDARTHGPLDVSPHWSAAPSRLRPPSNKSHWPGHVCSQARA